jgi:hypothetical protein
MTTGRNPRQRKGHQYRSLPIQEWPDNDRKAWAEACRPGVRLKPGGRASHFAEVSLKDFTTRYGAYLGFLQRRAVSSRSSDPSKRQGLRR